MKRMQHAKLSASGSSRWIACPGSVAAEEGLPDRTSKYAQEGIDAAEIADRALKSDVQAMALCGDFHRAMAIQEYLDYVRNIPGEISSEVRVHYDHVAPGGFGTCDAIVWDAERRDCHIVDLKFGRGVHVDVEENSQLLLYAIGADALYGPERAVARWVLHIVQPRTGNYGRWELSPDELAERAREMSVAARAALEPDAPRIPGEVQCRFCLAAGNCPALAAWR